MIATLRTITGAAGQANIDLGIFMRDPRSILITGASSGIGEALAVHYARPGATLALTGTDAARLDAVAQRCRNAGAAVLPRTVDVADADAMAGFVAEADTAAPLDLVIANAGISAGTGDDHEGYDQTRRIMRVNVDGVFNTILPAVARLLARPKPADRPRGQVAIMSSLASFRGFPGAPAYCASKAAVRIWGEALRGDLWAEGIEVAVICPGYVRSRMTAGNRFRMPLLMDSERAAHIVAKGLARNRGRIAFPWRLHALLQFVTWLPIGWTERLTRRLPRKAGGKG
jgi:short-subunit dehydrogenase